MTASEQFHLNWQNFESNLKISYSSLRKTSDFSDVTLVCADEKKIDAHKVILATASPFFYNILQTINHPHPLIYMKGLEWKDLSDIIDFIYHGEIYVAQQSIRKFLETAEELKLKDLSKSEYMDMSENEQFDSNETSKETTNIENNIVQSIKSEPPLFQEDKSNDLPNPHSCNYCPNSYDKRTSLKKHIWRKHNDNTNVEYQENFDNTNKASEGDKIKLQPEIISKSFPCVSCPNTYTLPDSLKKHIWRNHKESKSIKAEGGDNETNQSTEDTDLREDSIEANKYCANKNRKS